MYLPISVLAAIGVAFLALLFIALRRRGSTRDPMAPPSGPPEMPRSFAPRPSGLGGGGLTPEIEAEVRALMAANQKIHAIKLVREATRMGLAEAKDHVERM